MSIFSPTKIGLLRLLKRFREHSFHRQFINRGDLVFDIGANIGRRSSIYLRLGARVVAVEPQTACVELLKKKFSSNPHFTIVQKAVADVPGEAEIFISNVSEISTLSEEYREHCIEQKSFSYDTEEKVGVTTLEQLIHEFGIPGYIKIDVETFEWKVLKTLSVPVKLISFEYYEPFKSVAFECLDFLSGKFEYNFMRLEDMKFELKEWVGKDQLIDYLLSLKDLTPAGEIFARSKLR